MSAENQSLRVVELGHAEILTFNWKPDPYAIYWEVKCTVNGEIISKSMHYRLGSIGLGFSPFKVLGKEMALAKTLKDIFLAKAEDIFYHTPPAKAGGNWLAVYQQ